MQAFTFYASDDKLRNRGHIEVGEGDAPLTCKGINSAACDLARQVSCASDKLEACELGNVDRINRVAMIIGMLYYRYYL